MEWKTSYNIRERDEKVVKESISEGKFVSGTPWKIFV
jgi:hypothetical protein